MLWCNKLLVNLRGHIKIRCIGLQLQAHRYVVVHIADTDAVCSHVCACSVGEFSFLGALILESVVSELASLHRLSEASDIYLAGTRYLRSLLLATSCRSGSRRSCDGAEIGPRLSSGYFRTLNPTGFKLLH